MQLEAGTKTTVVARYGTIVERRVKVLVPGEVLQTRGPRVAPSAVLLWWRPRRGAVLAAAPGGRLPDGLFAAVAGTRRTRDGSWLVRLRRADLSRAFPALDLHQAIDLRRRTGAHAAQAPTIGAELGGLSCETGTVPSGSLSLSGNYTLRPDYEWKLGQAPHGSITVGVNGQMGVSVNFAAGVHCNQQLLDYVPPKLLYVLMVGDIPVPVFLGSEVSVGVEAQQPTTFTGHIGVGVSDTLNWSLSGLSLIPPQWAFDFGATLTGGANFTGGVTLKAVFGMPDLKSKKYWTLNAHGDLRLELVLSPDDGDTWRLDGRITPSIGVEIGPIRGSKDMQSVSHEIRRHIGGKVGTPAPGLGPSGPAVASAPSGGGSGTAPATLSSPDGGLVQYGCANDNSNIGHYVPAGRFWTEDFVPSGGSISGGHLQLGANQDGGDHRARIGIYRSFGLGGPLGEVVVPVSGYGGVDFRFPSPLSVTPGTTYYLTASGVGDFTAYDNRQGCFIGQLVG